jgi:hypothetical protein
MRHSTPTSHPQGVKVTHSPRFFDSWSYLDKVSHYYDPAYGGRWFMDCGITDSGALCCHGELNEADARRYRTLHRGVAWRRVPLAVRRAIMADHPEWVGTVWTV